jgi:DNA uptake protein ComE-like DNA-binding protein
LVAIVGSAFCTININTVSATELVAVTGIPREQAFLITEDRAMHGKFLTVESLYRVGGIDPEVVAQLIEDAGVVAE